MLNASLNHILFSRSNWWNTAALYDFDFINLRYRDVVGAANLTLANSIDVANVPSNLPRLDSTGLLVNNTSNFDDVKMKAGSAQETAVAGNVWAVMMETSAHTPAFQASMGVNTLNRVAIYSDGNTQIDSQPDGSTFISATGSVNVSTQNVRMMYRQNGAGASSICIGGGTVVTSAAVILPSTRPLYYGGGGPNNGRLNSVAIRRLQIFNGTQSDADMQKYTTGSTT